MADTGRGGFFSGLLRSAVPGVASDLLVMSGLPSSAPGDMKLLCNERGTGAGAALAPATAAAAAPVAAAPLASALPLPSLAGLPAGRPCARSEKKALICGLD